MSAASEMYTMVCQTARDNMHAVVTRCKIERPARAHVFETSQPPHGLWCLTLRSCYMRILWTAQRLLQPAIGHRVQSSVHGRLLPARNYHRVPHAL